MLKTEEGWRAWERRRWWGEEKRELMDFISNELNGLAVKVHCLYIVKWVYKTKLHKSKN